MHSGTLKGKRAMIVGCDSLRCLALATVDEPRKKEDMNLTDPTQFIHFEVCWFCYKILITGYKVFPVFFDCPVNFCIFRKMSFISCIFLSRHQDTT